MKLATYRASVESAARLGVIVDDMIVDVEALAACFAEQLPDNMLDMIDAGPAAVAALKSLVEDCAGQWPVNTAWPVQNVTLLAPIPRPRKNIFGIGLNYVEHVAESAKSLDTSKDLPEKPVVFSKPPTSVVGPGDPILHDKNMTQQLDWEVELAVIIGRKASRIEKDAAMDCVFGYSVMLDVSARDNRRAGQWIFSKGQDSYAPFGPVIVTADEIEDPHNLNLWLTVNGTEKQNSNTRHMLFNVPTLIADISSGITLEPGDIIATGTPEGVGAGREPQEFMWPGDVIECGVENIGVLRNPVVDSSRN
ncbi:fumarylacetoacetate hydrolase family protein [Sneathiella chinensis]|uniref:Gentisate 1,2-dioxygenase n=1 Tax=Sneathiella chinensis TaxID=349750 RepID=A0ABQ5U533_9PROT|nr:fumarylacetoacetate hydrolase family protein [Sneathiella chinensis]GLQ06856.1 gentisate 1,2-dioxygenase [Sneathiella chinensis]